MITLGLNAAFHDSAAVLVIDGVPVAAAEEERFTRIKHAKRPLPFTAWELPFHAIAWCLQQAGISLAEVDHVAYSFDPWRFAAGRPDLPTDEQAQVRLPLSPSDLADPRLKPWDSPWDGLFLTYIVNAPRQLCDGAPHHLTRRLYGPDGKHASKWQWHYVDHHLCHQASAFLAAPYDSCAVMTLDGRGERATTSYGVWRHGLYRSLGEVLMPNSLGMMYEKVTSHLGFLHSSDEYKVMALAAMGKPLWADLLADQVQWNEGGQFELGPLDFEALAGPPRRPGSPLLPQHLDLAASVQQVLERKVLRLAEWLREASGEQQLAMAGGVALNCVMNARLRDEGPFEGVWIQPAAGDAGTALGAALWTDARERWQRQQREESEERGEDSSGPSDMRHGWPLAPRRWVMEHAYLGPQWDDDSIEQLLRWSGLAYERMADDAALVERGAALLADGQVLGWFQGRMEWGPRALGARSILASPIDPAMQARLNELKDREDFRPVAPAVTAEAFSQWFTTGQGPADGGNAQAAGRANGGTSPFMLFTHQVLPEQAARIPSACHSDGSARVQTVHATTNPRFHALLAAFDRLTGVPVLVNTSFNVRGEPVVCSPQDALQAFFTTPLDGLLIGRFVLVKPHVHGGRSAAPGLRVPAAASTAPASAMAV